MNASDPMVVLYVHEMARALRFYSEVLGLRVVSESPGWSTLACDGCVVALHALYPGASEGTTSFAGLNLRVDDLDAALAELEKGGGRVVEVREAELPRIPVRLAEVVDTEGNGLELRQVVA